MADTTLKFVFQDDTQGGSARPQSSMPEREPVAGEATRAAAVAGRPRATAAAAPGEATPGRTNQLADAAISALGRQLERLPFFGQALKLLTEIATATKAFEALRSGGGFIRELLSRTFAETAARASAGAASRTTVAPGSTVVDSVATAVDSFTRGFDRARRRAVGEDRPALPPQRPPAAPALPAPASGGRSGGRNDGGDDDEPPMRIPRLPGLRGEALGREVIPRPPIAAPPAGGAGGAGGLINAGARLPVIPATSGGGALAAAGGGAGASGAAAAGGISLGAIAVGALAVVAAVGAATLAVRGLIEANNSLRKHVAEVADRLRPFSASIQAADARIEVARLRQDIERAQQNGGRAAQFNEAQAKIDRALSRIATAIEGPLLDAVTPVAEAVGDLLEISGKILNVVTQVANAGGAARGVVKTILETQLGILQIAREEHNELPPEADLLGAFANAPDLPVFFDGRVFNGDGPANFGRAQFREPLPMGKMR